MADIRKKYPDMTPEEFDSELKGACQTIRERMAKKGHEMPESDEELLEIVRHVMGKK